MSSVSIHINGWFWPLFWTADANHGKIYRVLGEAPPVEYWRRLLPRMWSLLKPFFSELRLFVQLVLHAQSFYKQFWQTKNVRPLSSVNGTNRSQLKHPRRCPFNLTGLNKTMECFGWTPDKRTPHIQSLINMHICNLLWCVWQLSRSMTSAQ